MQRPANQLLQRAKTRVRRWRFSFHRRCIGPTGSIKTFAAVHSRCPLRVISGQTLAGQNPPLSALVQKRPNCCSAAIVRYVPIAAVSHTHSITTSSSAGDVTKILRSRRRLTEWWPRDSPVWRLLLCKCCFSYGTVILPSTTITPDGSTCTMAISPESSFTSAIVWMLVTCETSIVSCLAGIFFINSRP
jgi:hypothetical protein